MGRIHWGKAAASLTAAILFFVCSAGSGRACELLYAGGDMTDDGANMFMRAEESQPDSNKVYYVSPAGRHAEGEVYQGCTDFTWTFTHDSYRYTACCDGMISGICAGCGGDHAHTPYEESGTNDHGVTVSATQSLNANAAIQRTDPFIDGGIDESVMATVLLSEAATAREGVELLAGIYDSAGADYEGSGVRQFIGQFDALSVKIHEEKSMKAREEMMTRADMEMAAQAHDLALELYRYLSSDH